MSDAVYGDRNPSLKYVKVVNFVTYSGQGEAIKIDIFIIISKCCRDSTSHTVLYTVHPGSVSAESGRSAPVQINDVSPLRFKYSNPSTTLSQGTSGDEIRERDRKEGGKQFL